MTILGGLTVNDGCMNVLGELGSDSRHCSKTEWKFQEFLPTLIGKSPPGFTLKPTIMKLYIYFLLLVVVYCSSCYVNREPELSLSVVYLEQMDTISRYDKPELMYKWKSLESGQHFYTYGKMSNIFHPGVTMYAFTRR